MFLKLTDKNFSDIGALKEFLIENDIVKHQVYCTKCNEPSELKIYTEKNKNKLIYRCNSLLCRKRKGLTNSKLGLKDLIHIIYLIISGVSYKQIYLYHGISTTTISGIKKKIRNCYEKYLEKRPICLGGLNVIVEADETVLSRRGIIRNPTSTDDEMIDTVWILGAINLDDKSKFVLKRVKDRQVETLTRALEDKIMVCSQLHSDGHPSYPGVCMNLNLSHKVVIHIEGFKGIDGPHTNNIEGFWSHLKSTMRKEHGVQRNNIDKW
ncbi:hypothetical protein DMUE_6197, partial [Dictyocoela muelleri]